MDVTRTTAAVQRYLDELRMHPLDAQAPPAVRELLERSAQRLQLLCASMIRRSYPRLARPPLNLAADDILGAVAERLMKAMRDVRPASVREFFGLANQHMRWELNDLARRLDEHTPPIEITQDIAEPNAASDAGPGPNARRLLEAFDQLGAEEREVLGLIRIQGLTHDEAAEVLGVSTKTIQRRLNRGRVLLAAMLNDFQDRGAAGAADAGG